MDEQTADSTLLIKLKLAFEERFRYDADGVPKVWKPEDDIDTAFRIAKDEVSAIMYGTLKMRTDRIIFTDSGSNPSLWQHQTFGCFHTFVHSDKFTRY